MALVEEGPYKTDCLTSIHYIFKRASSVVFSVEYIGDVPRQLVQSGWVLQIIDSNELCTGDLIFLKRRSESKLISHAALVVGPDQLFHCKRDTGALIESIEKVWEVFEQKVKENLSQYIDIRNKDLREKYGIYLP